MLKWIGSTNSPLIGFGEIFEAKAPIGLVKFQVGATKGVKDKVWVHTANPAHWGKSGWNYWMSTKAAQAHGIQDGSIVHVTKGHQPLKPGDIDPETGKPAPAAMPPAGTGTSTASPSPAPPAAPAAPVEPPPAPKAASPAPVVEPEPAKEPETPPPPAPKEPEPPAATKGAPEEPAQEPGPEVVPPSTTKETSKLKKKVPLGTVRYHSIKAGEPAKQVLIRATDDPASPRGGWKYLMTVDAAAKQGIHHDDVLAFTYTPDPNNVMKGKITLHTDEHGHIKKLSTAAQFPKPEPKPEEPKPELKKPEEPKPEEPKPKPEEPKLEIPKPEEPKKAEEPKPEPPKAEEPPTPASEPSEAPPEAVQKAKQPPAPADNTKEIVAYIKTLPDFAIHPETYITPEKPTLFDKGMQAKFGTDWYAKWKKAVVTKMEPEAPGVADNKPSVQPKKTESGWTPATPTKFEVLLGKHGIESDSDVGLIVSYLNTNGPTPEGVLFKATKLAAPHFAAASLWLEKQGLAKSGQNGVYFFTHLWHQKAAPPSEPKQQKPEPSKTEPEASPSDKAKPKPGATVGKAEAELAPVVIPSVDELKFVASGSEHGLEGAGEKSVYKDKKGHEWIFKIAKAKDGSSEKPFAAYAQECFANIAMQVKSIHIPVKVTHIKGKMGTLQPWIPNSGNLKHAPSPATLTPQEREDVASEHMLDWLMSQHDSFGANLVRTKTGRIVGVDKEQGFRYFGADKLSTDYKPNTEFHGEKPPYYNQFWKEWADKKFDFDPTTLKKYFDSVDAIDDDAFLKNFEPYAQSFWEDKPKKQDEFLNELRKRKQNLRGDFEKFISEQYRLRTGQTEGEFTFKAGWVPGAAPTTGKKFKTYKYNADTMAGDYGLSTKAYVPSQGPDKGVSDPTKITVKASKGPAGLEKLNKFAKEMQLTPFVPEYSKEHADSDGFLSGSVYNIGFFKKKDWDSASVEKTEEIGLDVGSTPPEPEFHPEIEASPHAHSNLHELEGLHHVVISALGKRLTLDGGAVEGQHAKAKKFIDKKGEPYYLFQFKLREPTWSKISGGNLAHWAFTQAKWEPSKHAFVESSGHSDTVDTKKWANGASEVHLVTGKSKWTYMGSMYAKVRPAKGQTPAQALHGLLEAVEPGFASKVLTPPSPEEQEVVKLSRVLWSVSPQESDGLPESKRTVHELKKRLKVLGYDEQKLSELQEIEAFPGYASWSKPGRYKEMAKGKLRFLFNGISSPEGSTAAALSVLQYGLLGIHERNLLGLQQFGGSYPSDVASGSGDGILTRVATDSGFKHTFQDHPFCGHYQALIVPTEVDRLDTYMYHSEGSGGDHYGNCRADDAEWKNRPTVEAQMAKQQKNYHVKAELALRKGVGRGKLIRMVCANEKLRKDLIVSAKQHGIMQVNGVPIDDFVVVCTNLGDAYNKYVKPLGF